MLGIYTHSNSDVVGKILLLLADKLKESNKIKNTRINMEKLQTKEKNTGQCTKLLQLHKNLFLIPFARALSQNIGTFAQLSYKIR